jgi:hypothetical protein
LATTIHPALSTRQINILCLIRHTSAMSTCHEVHVHGTLNRLMAWIADHYRH